MEPKEIRPFRGKYMLQRMIEEGEHLHQDFKFAISDARKIARSISAFANAEGGRLLVGVKDNGIIAGVRYGEEEIYVVEHAAERYCRPSQRLEISAINAGEGMVVVRVEVAASSVRPVEVDEGGGEWKAYCRVADENIVAHRLMVAAWRGEGALALSDAERRVLAALGEERLTPEQTAMGAGMSLALTERAIVALARLELIRFVHDGPGWKIEVT